MSRFWLLLVGCPLLVLSTSAVALPSAVTPTGAERVRAVRVHGALQQQPRHADAPTAAVVPRTALQRSPRLAEALAQTVGAKAERAGGLGHAAQLRIRASTTQQVTWALDDIPLRAPDGAPFDPGDVPVSALSRVELYRGGSPSALGSQAIGGTARLALRRPDSGGFNLTLGGGSWRSLLLDGAVGWQGIGDGLLAVRVVSTAGDYPYTHDGGTLFWQRDDTERRRRNNDARRASAILRQRVTIGPWRLELRALAAARDQGLPGLALYESLSSRLRSDRQDVVFAATRKSYLLRGDRLVATVYVGRQRTEVNDKLGEQGIPIELNQRVWSRAANARWRSPPGRSLRWTARLAAERADLQGADRAQRQQRPDVAQQLFDATVGARWRASKAVVTSANINGGFVVRDRYTLQPEAAQWTTVDASDRFVGSGAIGVQARPNRWFSARAAARLANRVPNLAELYGNAGTVLGNALLRDERALGVQLGAALRSSPSRWGLLQAVAFARQTEDLISLVRVSPARAVHQNIGATTHAGAEVSGSLKLAPRRVATMDVDGVAQASWTFHRARDATEDVRYAGKPLPFAPLTTTRATATAGISTGKRGLRRVELTGRWSWRAGHFADRAATVVIPPMQVVGANAMLRFTESLSCSLHWDRVLGDGAFDVLGFPLPVQTFIGRCSIDGWGS